MRAILIIAWKDLKQRLRDRSAIVAAFIAPLGIAFIVSAAFGGGFVDSFEATYAVVDQDQSVVSKAFTEQVLGGPQFEEQVTIRPMKDPVAARRLVASGDVGAAFVIPPGFAEAVTNGRAASITVLRNPEAEIASDVAVAIADGYTTQINASRLAVATTLRVQGQPLDPDRLTELANASAADRIPIELVDGEVGVREVSGVNYFGPAMAVFSLFFTTAFVARSLIAERQEGTLPRVLAAPVPRSSVVLGKASSAFVLGLVSFTVMFLIFGLLLDVSWGDPLALVVLTVATVLAVMGLMTVAQTGARTIEGADAVAQVMTVTLALLGGSFFPIFQMPEIMQRLSYLTPNGWALRGYTDIAYDGATLGDLGPHLAAITAFAVVTGGLGIWRSRKIA
ncbi:MAG: ABC transporter permease [Actinomycetota bacterium]